MLAGKANMKSVGKQSQVVARYLQEECATGRVIDLLIEDNFLDTGCTVNHFEVIPKGLTGKWCMIVDLPFPEGRQDRSYDMLTSLLRR